ncbi:MAG: FAD:protein FMN transferase [Nanoarchaeota archaeon]|nr:FAD:protein FMN transferase [Nanoarchaeota archaeon]
MKRIFILLLVSLLIAGCTVPSDKTEQTKEYMGTFVTITVYGEEEAKANEAINKAYREIERIEGLLSNYKNDSEIYLLNSDRVINDASNELVYIISKSLKYGDLSDGAFDITVQPILDLYATSFEELKRPPTDDEIKETKKLVGYEKIYLKNKQVELKENMKITLGGIAKGYIIDKAIDILSKEGISNALVNAGGDVRAIGSKGNDNWKIALQNPRDEKDFITTISVNDTAVCTSGDYERYFDDDKKFHHIVDPRTGHSATELISVTIISKKAIDCDALATSVFVLGKTEGLELIQRFKDVEGLIITKDKEIVKSRGFGY